MSKQQKIHNDQNNVVKKNYLKNYFILALIFIVCFGLTIYFCKWYEVYKEYQKEIPVIRGSLLEIHSDELEHFLVDNPNSIVYMCNSYSDICREYEKKLKKYLAKSEVTDSLVYLNLTNEEADVFLDKFNKKYPFRNKLKGYYPAFVVFDGGKVVNILQSTQRTPLSIAKTQSFLELYFMEEEGIGIDDSALEENDGTFPSE